MSVDSVPFTVHELDMARVERSNKRLIAIVVLLIVLFAATNGFWIWRELQYEDVVTTTTVEAEQDAESGSNQIVVGGDLNG